MFDIGITEILVIAIIAIIVVGPKDLPILLRKIGGFVSYIKSLSADFQSHIKDTIDETGVKDIKDSFEGAGQYDWSDEDDRNAQSHNENIMREHEAGSEEKGGTAPKKTRKKTSRKTPVKRRKTPKKNVAS